MKEYEKISDFHEGFARISRFGKYNFIRMDGDVLSEVDFDDVEDFNGDVARVRIGKEWKLLRPDGRLVEEEK